MDCGWGHDCATQQGTRCTPAAKPLCLIPVPAATGLPLPQAGWCPGACAHRTPCGLDYYTPPRGLHSQYVTEVHRWSPQGLPRRPALPPSPADTEGAFTHIPFRCPSYIDGLFGLRCLQHMAQMVSGYRPALLSLTLRQPNPRPPRVLNEPPQNTPNPWT